MSSHEDSTSLSQEELLAQVEQLKGQVVELTTTVGTLRAENAALRQSRSSGRNKPSPEDLPGTSREQRVELLSNLVEIPFQANGRSVRCNRHLVDLAAP